jgi:ferredoxin
MTDTTTDPLVIFTPSGKRGRFAVGTPILTAARQIGVDLDSVCGGRGICSKCQITPSYGEFPKHGVTVHEDALSEWNKVEERYRSKRGLIEGRRLGCQAQVQGDVVIDVPPESQVHKQVVRKRAEAREIVMDPATRLYYVEVAEPDMHNPKGDLERLIEALEEQWSLAGVIGDLRTMQGLQMGLRDGKWKVTVAIYDGRNGVAPRIMQVWPGYYEGSVYGAAFDIGSTTVACHLCDLITGEVKASSGLMNPQIRFGEDLMSRVSYSMMNPGGATEMTQAVRKAVNTLIGQVAGDAGIARTDIVEGVFVGNPVMHHLLLGIDPVELGWAPFALATSNAMTLWAREIDVSMPLHRRACRRRRRRRGAEREPAPAGRDDAGGRCRHQCRDRARQPRQAARLLVPHRPGLRGGADLQRSARRSRRHRAGADRPGDQGAALPGDRLRALVRRPRLRRGGRPDRGHRHLRLRHHRGDRRDAHRRDHRRGRRHRQPRGAGHRAHGRGRPHLGLRAA